MRQAGPAVRLSLINSNDDDLIHTVISIIAVITAVVALVQTGKINPKSLTSKWYIVLTILTCLTGLPIMRTGHPTPGHTLAIKLCLLPAVLQVYVL